jgi:hypothetical protein
VLTCKLDLIPFTAFYHLTRVSAYFRGNLPSLRSPSYLLCFYLIASRLSKSEETRQIIDESAQTAAGMAWHDTIHPEKRSEPGLGQVQYILFNTACLSVGRRSCDVFTTVSDHETNSEVLLVIDIFRIIQSGVETRLPASRVENSALLRTYIDRE